MALKDLIPENLHGKAMFDFIVKNEAFILNAKKNAMKFSDSVSSTSLYIDEKGNITSKAKADLLPISKDANKINLSAVINTTNYFDSHWDVHIPGLWKRNLANNKKKMFYLLKQHENSFEGVISDAMNASAQKISWTDLGYDYIGITEALMFNGDIAKERNPFMFDQYAKGYVKEHSVGMEYVKLVTCINDEDSPVQKENWDKYRPMIINGEEADAKGVFWAVLEAKVREGSAVLFGSNNLTPVHSMEDLTDYNEQKNETTQTDPAKTTQDDSVNRLVEYKSILKTIKLI
jgi:hypothetical protein